MGLDISPADYYDAERENIVNFDAPTAHWSYGGFHRFRALLAAEDGIDLEAMEGFTEMFDLRKTAPPGRPWQEAGTTLTPLLNHSDCDGELTPDECTRILPRLKEIRVKWAGDVTSESMWDVKHLDALIDVVTYCAATGVNVDFH